MKALLFSYGTLQDDKVQLELFGRKLQGSKDILKGYRMMAIEIQDEAFLSQGEKDQKIAVRSNDHDDIQGTVFEITEEELLLADQYEPEDYKRILVTLGSGKKAWIYAATTTG